ncbi:MAG: hypothetical protein AAGG38_06895 [Planctomycetota bacterium]
MMRWWCLVLGLAAVCGGARAQVDEIRLGIEQGYAGLDGLIRPGSWTPIRVTVDNLSADDRDVFLRWELRDGDGDRVVAQRRVTLTRQREGQPVWLYAAVPVETDAETVWTLRAVDAESGALLASLAVQPQAEALLREDETLVAVTTTAGLGFNDYQRHELQQRPIRLVRGLSLSRLPDRWQGLDALHALVWTQDQGGDPSDPLQVSEAAVAAVREWVVRGGHLVVMLPEVGETWTGSAFADLLPVTAGQLRRHDTDRWWAFDWIGGRRAVRDSGGAAEGEVDGSAVLEGRTEPGEDRLTVTSFAVAEDGPATVLLRDEAGRAVAVAGRVGFGRVTVVGVDLTSSTVRRNALYLSPRRLWNHVFNWRFPVLSEVVSEAEVRNNRLVPAERTREVGLLEFVPGRIALTGTIGALLIGAVFLFGLYWVAAGWLLQPVLKRYGMERWAWVGFTVLVLGVAGVAWGGASLLRPRQIGAEHVTVLDYDGNRNLARGRAFVSLFVPRFGRAEVSVGSPELSEAQAVGLAGGVHNLIASPGLSASGIETGFIDVQRYVVDAARPDTLDLPVRATSKQMRLDYLGPVDRDLPGLARPFSIGVAQPIVAGPDGGPVGEVRHTLPGELTNVRVIFCRGEAFDRRGKRRQLEPEVWRYVNGQGENRWAPGEPLVLAGRAAEREALIGPFMTWAQIPVEREWKLEGLLGRRLGEMRGAGAAELATAVDESVIARQLELLSFFDALPPADVKRNPNVPDLTPRFTVSRRLGGRLDLTALTHGRRVIILGHLRDSPLPVPMSVDGRTPPSTGWTVVRWVYDF